MYCKPESSDEVMKITSFVKEMSESFNDEKQVRLYMAQNSYYHITFLDGKIGFSHVPVGSNFSINEFIDFVKNSKNLK
jgi:hypothetical protein